MKSTAQRALVWLVAFLAVGCDREVLVPSGLAWDEAMPVAYAMQRRLVTTNNGEDTLTFIDPAGPTGPLWLDTVPVGHSPVDLEGPHHAAVSPDGQFLYLNLSNFVVQGGSGPHGAHGLGTVPGSLGKLSLRTNRLVGSVLVDRSPGDVILSGDGERAYVSHYDLARYRDAASRGLPEVEGFGTVVIVETRGMTVLSSTRVCPTPHGMTLLSDQRTLVVTCTLADQLALVDVSQAAAPRLLTKVDVGPNPSRVGNPAYAPYALRLHPGGLVYVSNNQSGDVRVFDPVTQAMRPDRTVLVSGVAMFGDLDAAGERLYVATQAPDRLVAIALRDASTRGLSLGTTGCLSPHATRVLSPSLLAVVCEGDHRTIAGRVVFVDLDRWQVTSSLPVGLYADALELIPQAM